MKSTRSPQPDPGGGAPRRRRRTIEYLIVLAACAVFVSLLVGDKGLLALVKAREEYRALEASVSQLRASNARKREEARRLREDPRAIEELARRELGLIKPGEKLFIVTDVPPASDDGEDGAQ